MDPDDGTAHSWLQAIAQINSYRFPGASVEIWECISNFILLDTGQLIYVGINGNPC